MKSTILLTPLLCPLCFRITKANLSLHRNIPWRIRRSGFRILSAAPDRLRISPIVKTSWNSRNASQHSSVKRERLVVVGALLFISRIRELKMKHVLKLFAGSFLLVWPILCSAQGTLRVTFNGDPQQLPGTSFSVQQYFESGIWFRPLGVVGPGNGFSHRRAAVTGRKPPIMKQHIWRHI